MLSTSNTDTPSVCLSRPPGRFRHIHLSITEGGIFVTVFHEKSPQYWLTSIGGHIRCRRFHFENIRANITIKALRQSGFHIRFSLAAQRRDPACFQNRSDTRHNRDRNIARESSRAGCRDPRSHEGGEEAPPAHNGS